MPYVATSPTDLLNHLSGIAHVAEDKLVIDDAGRFRSEAAADLAWTAAFTADEATAEAARWIVWEASQALDAKSASIQELYMARGRGEISGFTVPAINLRAQTFDMARTIFATAMAKGGADWWGGDLWAPLYARVGVDLERDNSYAHGPAWLHGFRPVVRIHERRSRDDR